MDQQKLGLSFGFSKVQEARNLSKSIINETSEVKDEKDFVLSVEGKEVNSTKPQVKKNKEYIIPLIKRNNWRGDDKDNTEIESDVSSQNLDTLAAQEILQETARYNETWSDRGTENTTLSIPLLMQNKIPEGFESEEKLDVALRPDEPDEADYEKIPIEHYGMAMLRGMGWNQNRGIGKNAKVVVPIEAHIRPKGLGLGADKRNSNTNKTLMSETSADNIEALELNKNSYCVVTNGINKDLYGTVEGLDEDNARVMVKLALTGRVINVIQSYISVVGKKEFDKYSKYLNKAKADKYKESEVKAMNNGQSNIGHDSYEKSSKHKHKKHKRGSRDNSPHLKRKKYSRDEDNYSGTQGYKKHDNKKSKSTHSGSSVEGECSEPSSLRPWLRNDLKVRVIDRHLKKGKYYNDKVVIIDIPSTGLCICRTDDGRVLENIHQSSLETVVPKEENAYVAIVSGTYCGEIGQILKRHKDKCIAVVQLLSDRDHLLRLNYDEICHYVGNIHHHNDY